MGRTVDFVLQCLICFLVQSVASKGQTLDAIEEMDSPDLCKDKESSNNGSETRGRRNRCVMFLTVHSKGNRNVEEGYKMT